MGQQSFWVFPSMQMRSELETETLLSSGYSVGHVSTLLMTVAQVE